MSPNAPPTGERLMITFSNRQVFGVAGTIITALFIALVGGYWLFIQDTFTSLKASVDGLRVALADETGRLRGDDAETRTSIRQHGDTLAEHMGRMTAEIVTTNREISSQVGQLRIELTEQMRDSDRRIMERFDRIDDRLERFLDPIFISPTYVSPGIFEISADGVLFDDEGRAIGKVPIYIGVEADDLGIPE